MFKNYAEEQKKPKSHHKQPTQVVQKQQPQTKKLPTKDPSFFKFCRWLAYPHYKGLYVWQKECIIALNDAKYQNITVSRDHGKSILIGNIEQYKMQYQNYDVLYLGWTDRRKEVAQNVCNFFEIYGEMNEKKSEYHFTIKNGGKFDCYLITSKDTLGMHSFGKQERFDNLTPEELEEFKGLFSEDGVQDGIFTEKVLKEYIQDRNENRRLLIVIDDPIDDSFMKELFKEEDLERRFMSTIFNINPDQWIFTGTRKFNGDFFDFIRKTFKGRLVEFIRGPYLREGETRYNTDLTRNPKNLTCPERFTHPELPSYKNDMLTGKRDLDEIYQSLLNSGKVYWWYAEYWNDPHPITGQVFDSIMQVDILQQPVGRKHDLCYVTIDRATTRQTEAHQKDADYTGCVIGLREIGTGVRVITHDLTGYIDIDQLLLRINDFVFEFKKQHEHIMIILIIEKQGGGQDFITLIRNSVGFIRKDGITVKNYIREICAIVEIHNTGEKLQRIRDRIYAPIINKQLRIMSMLIGSAIVNQILSFPNCDKFDAIDAVANAEFVLLENYPTVMQGETIFGELEKIYNDYAEGKLKDPLEEPKGENVLFMEKMGIRKRRSVFE